MNSRSLSRIGLIVALLLSAATPSAKGQRISHLHDHVLNDRGASRLTLATGIPYVGVGEYAYGISNRVTVGVLAGATPSVMGYGVRARAVVRQTSDRFRIYFCTPVIYYPKTRALGGDPWWLVRPNLSAEWISPGGFRYKAGGSLIGAASHYSLFGDPGRARFSPGVWNAVHGGISFPVGRTATFQVETSLVMKGFRVAGRDWVGGPPVILVLGTSWVL